MSDPLYTPAWQAEYRWTHEWSTRALFAAFAHLGVPKSLLDVGCGEGHLVKLAGGIGLKAFGVDISVMHDSEYAHYVLVDHDLRQSLDLGDVFDMVLCWEVAEHLPPSAAETLCDSVARHVGAWLVWTAAQPGQGGYHHVNERPPVYWRELLGARGLTLAMEETRALHSTWVHVTGPCWWYPNNLMVFRREPE